MKNIQKKKLILIISLTIISLYLAIMILSTQSYFIAKTLADIEYFPISIFKKEKTTDYFFKKANKYAQKNNSTKAIAYYVKTTEINPEFWPAYVNKGVVQSKNKEYQNALNAFNQAIKINPKQTQLYRYRASMKNLLGKYKNAIMDYDRAILLNPNDFDSYYDKATTRTKIKDYNGVIEDFNKLIELKPDYSSAHYARGFAKEKLKDYKGALDDYRQELVVISKQPNFHNTNNFKKAQNICTNATPKSPSSVTECKKALKSILPDKFYD